jgi:hypothetical protein
VYLGSTPTHATRECEPLAFGEKYKKREEQKDKNESNGKKGN